MIVNTHDPESAHWYDSQGRPRHEATLREARKEWLAGSVTSILKVFAKPELDAYKLRQLLGAALTLRHEEGESEDQFAQRCVDKSREHAKNAADLGTKIHAAIAMRLEETEARVADPLVAKCAEGAIRILASRGLTPLPEWIEAPFYHIDEAMVYGGTIDLVAKEESGVLWLLDFKSQERPRSKLTAWDGYDSQLAAYANHVGVRRIANIMISTVEPGECKWIDQSKDFDGAFNDFCRAYGRWCRVKKYYPHKQPVKELVK